MRLWKISIGYLLLLSTYLMTCPATAVDTAVPQSPTPTQTDIKSPLPLLTTAEAYINLGDSFRDKKQYVEAIEAYTSAIKLDPNNAIAYFSLGVIYYQQERYPDAEKASATAMHLDQNLCSAYLCYASALWQQDRAQEALPYCRKAVWMAPTEPSVLVLLGELNYDLQQYDDAVVAMIAASALAPKLSIPHNYMARIAQQRGDTSRAIGEYQKALDLDPYEITALYEISALYIMKLNQPDKALPLIQQANQEMPDDMYIQNLLATTLLALKRYDEALLVAQSAADKNLHYATIYYTLGLIYQKLSRNDDAIAAWKHASENGETTASVELGGLYLKSGDYDNAIQVLEAVAETEQSNANLHWYLCQSYLKVGKKALAIKEYEQLKKLDPKKADELLGLI